MFIRKFLAWMFLLILPSMSALGESPVRIQVSTEPAAIVAGGSGVLVLSCEIKPMFHISDATNGLFEVKITPADWLLLGEPDYPKGEPDPIGGSVYRKTIHVRIPFDLKTVDTGRRTLILDVTVQPCDEREGICYPPETIQVQSQIEIIAKDGAASEPGGRGTVAQRLSNALEKGSFLAFLLVFLGGLLTSLTPCVYPMIPITMAVIGAQAGGKKVKGFVLSLFYVLGISVTFSILGIVAAKTGSLFGYLAQNPITVSIVAFIFFVMGLSMLGVFVMQMPPSVAAKLRGKKRSGFIGAFLTGLVAGLVVSPCISPLLVVILAWVAKTGSVLMGIGLLLSFSFGLGILFVLIGTFSGILRSLPKSGGWMEFVERFFGILLVVLALVFLKPILSTFFYRILWAAYLVVFAVFMGTFSSTADETAKKKIGRAAGILAIMFAACILFFSFAQKVNWNAPSPVPVSEKASANWLASDADGFRQAELTQQLVLIDFFAEWCASCKELDEKTWPDPRVILEMERFVKVKLDLTRNDERTRTLQKKYGIVGMPTVLVLNAKGEEKSRFEGFQTPEYVVEFLRVIR